MPSLSERIDELLAEDLTVADLDSDISRTTARLAVLQTLKKQIDTAAEILIDKVPTKPKAAAVVKRAPAIAAETDKKSSVRDVDKLAFDVGVYLKENGPRRRDKIQNAMNCTREELDAAAETVCWFEKDGGMFTLSSDGHVHFNEQREAS